jgi:hypothetical protein
MCAAPARRQPPVRRFGVDGGSSGTGLATLILALGITYWLMRDRDDRLGRPVPAGRTY